MLIHQVQKCKNLNGRYILNPSTCLFMHHGKVKTNVAQCFLLNSMLQK